jgi:hypothetical protein
MEEYEFQEAFGKLGKLLLSFSAKDKEKAEPYIESLNKIYFYANELRLSEIENTMLLELYRIKKK